MYTSLLRSRKQQAMSDENEILEQEVLKIRKNKIMTAMNSSQLKLVLSSKAQRFHLKSGSWQSIY